MSVIVKVIGSKPESDEYVGAVRLKEILESGLPNTVIGEIILHGGDKYKQVLAFALQNLTSAGGHRHRGFGKIECSMDGQAEIIREALSGVK